MLPWKRDVTLRYSIAQSWTDPLGKGFVEKDHLVHKYSQRLCVFHQLMFLRARVYLPFFSAKVFLIVTLSFGLNRTITPLL